MEEAAGASPHRLLYLAIVLRFAGRDLLFHKFGWKGELAEPWAAGKDLRLLRLLCVLLAGPGLLQKHPVGGGGGGGGSLC